MSDDMRMIAMKLGGLCDLAIAETEDGGRITLTAEGLGGVAVDATSEQLWKLAGEIVGWFGGKVLNHDELHAAEVAANQGLNEDERATLDDLVERLRYHDAQSEAAIILECLLARKLPR
jgi:hypothetical protein